jgi:hypothetical protein
MVRAGTRRSAISLMEVVLAIALLVPLMGTIFWFYSSTLETRDRAAETVRETQLARVVVNRIARELRQATGFSGGYGTGIFGTRHRISINTVVIPDKAFGQKRSLAESRRPGQFDLRQIDYYIAWDEINTDEENEPRAIGLVRRERRTFNQLAPIEDPEGVDSVEDGAQPDAPLDPGALGDGAPEEKPFTPEGSDTLGEEFDDQLQEAELEGTKQELYAPELKFIEFFYHDGNKWWDTWEIKQGNALPQMVMITVGYKSEIPEDEEIQIIKDILENEDDIEPIPDDRYLVIVRIPQADSFFGSRIQREMSSLADLDNF